MRFRRAATGCALLLVTSGLAAHARELTFAERVAAQEAIERVYHSHRIGVTKSFDEAVPRKLLERKVTRYLKQSVALEELWRTPVTAEMLERELQRMIDGTRSPARLRELFTALGDDSLLIQECLVRAALVERLTGNFYAFEPSFDVGLVETVASPAVAIPHDLGVLGDPCVDNDLWSNGSLDDAVSPRSHHTAVWTGTHMLVWGGVGVDYLDAGLRYDPATDTWAALSTLGAPEARASHTAIWTGSQMVVWGGRNSSSFLNSGGRYDPVTDVWMPTTLVDVPTARVLHTAVWTGTRMLIWGGVSGASGGSYDPKTDTWQPISVVDAPTFRFGHAAVWTGERMVVWGGESGSTDLETGGRYDPVSDTWVPTSIVGAPESRNGHTAVWTGDRMVVWGGARRGVQLRSGGLYDPARDTWTTVTTEGAPEAAFGHTATWTGNGMLVWAFGTGSLYDPSIDRWTPTSTAATPLPRWAHTAVWTGAQLVVWGGQGVETDAQGGENGRLNSGARYSLANDSWTPTSAGGPPAARRRHSAVWTGTHMVVWGGSGGAYHDTGGRYDPAIDTWAPVSLVDAPAPRDRHTAVWTGSHMVVWGGSNGSSMDTGGRYDPLADRWLTMSLVDAPPSQNGQHTAVWTGKRMLVWGVAAGGAYDPASDTWDPISQENAPSPRYAHVAVWTGNTMVVWGGFFDSTKFDTGARYDPTTDRWTPTSTVGAPPGRLRYSAVWTGDRMLLWGGSSGGAYDPVADTWHPISTADAPNRDYHTAVWNGNYMLIWGGYDADPTLFSEGGARYQPATDRWTPMVTLDSPEARFEHTALWTSTGMLVWGGLVGGGNVQSSGGLYVPFHLPDDDGDGYDECAADCNDAHAGIYPGAPELCDGLDNDCNFEIDEQVELQEVVRLVFTSTDTLSWQPGPPGLGSAHDVVRGALDGLPVGAGAAETCLASAPGETQGDEVLPIAGSGFWYLVRARNACATGTYGEQSDATERVTLACP